MKDMRIKREEAEMRAAEYAALPWPERAKRVLSAPGNSSKQVMRLYREKYGRRAESSKLAREAIVADIESCKS